MLSSINVILLRKASKSGGEKYVGLTLNIPLDSRTFNDIQSKKIDYLKSKLNLENSKDDEKTFFKTKLDKLSMIDERLQITKDDLDVYDSILKIINEEKDAQIKTQSDLDTLQNSQKIKFKIKVYFGGYYEKNNFSIFNFYCINLW